MLVGVGAAELRAEASNPVDNGRITILAKDDRREFGLPFSGDGFLGFYNKEVSKTSVEISQSEIHGGDVSIYSFSDSQTFLEPRGAAVSGLWQPQHRKHCGR